MTRLRMMVETWSSRFLDNAHDGLPGGLSFHQPRTFYPNFENNDIYTCKFESVDVRSHFVSSHVVGSILYSGMDKCCISYIIEHRVAQLIRTHGKCIEGTWLLVRAAIVAVAKVFEGQVLHLTLRFHIKSMCLKVRLHLTLRFPTKSRFLNLRLHMLKREVTHASKQASEQASKQAPPARKGPLLLVLRACLLA